MITTKYLDRIKAVTDADLPIEIVEKSYLDYLKTQNPTYVSTRQLRSSNGIIISENFARCQGITFLDNAQGIGALLHNYSLNDPYYTIKGQWSNGENIEDPQKIFNCMNRVTAVHVYDKSSYEWPENCVTAPLIDIGIEKIFHVPIKSKNGRNYWRDIALDVKEGFVYVFPTDFDYGIKIII